MAASTDTKRQELITCERLDGIGFGVSARLQTGQTLGHALAEFRSCPELLLDVFYEAGGLMVFEGLESIVEAPHELVEISSLFGSEVENYEQTLTPKHMIHEQIPQILLLSNLPPCERKPPPQPQPARTATGDLPVQFPHRRGWHTDQSFRRPPPDISLFYAVEPVPRGQGQTLFADGVSAYEALPEATRNRIEPLNGLHALLGTGRSEQAVRAGEPVTPVEDHQRSQPQPLVRKHPVTGKSALYSCESGQMDWHDGPIVGLQPGVVGDGAALLYELMTHYTQPAFTYVHEWRRHDLVIYDNRCLIHAATWYDSDRHARLMWRTTVGGNPGGEYQGEEKSWIPRDGAELLHGLGEARWDPAEKTSV